MSLTERELAAAFCSLTKLSADDLEKVFIDSEGKEDFGETI